MLIKHLFNLPSSITNHRPAFGLQADKLAMAFELLGFDTSEGMTGQEIFLTSCKLKENS